MKTVLINVGAVLAILLVYKIDFFGWFTGRGMLLFSVLLVVAMFFVAFRVVGNPFVASDEDENEEDKK